MSAGSPDERVNHPRNSQHEVQDAVACAGDDVAAEFAVVGLEVTAAVASKARMPSLSPVDWGIQAQVRGACLEMVPEQ